MAKEHGISSAVGITYLRYADDLSQTQEEIYKNRRAFAEVIVLAIEDGTHEEKVTAINALLEAIEAQIRIKVQQKLTPGMPGEDEEK